MLKKKQKTGSDAGFDIVSTIIFVFAIIVCLYPFIWMILNAFRTSKELFQNPLGFPQTFDFSIYRVAWERANFSNVFLNSIIVTVGSIILVLITAAPAAFALARIKFKSNAFFQRLFTSSIIISTQIILIPLFFYRKGSRFI